MHAQYTFSVTLDIVHAFTEKLFSLPQMTIVTLTELHGVTISVALINFVLFSFVQEMLVQLDWMRKTMSS